MSIIKIHHARYRLHQNASHSVSSLIANPTARGFAFTTKCPRTEDSHNPTHCVCEAWQTLPAHDEAAAQLCRGPAFWCELVGMVTNKDISGQIFFKMFSLRVMTENVLLPFDFFWKITFTRLHYSEYTISSTAGFLKDFQYTRILYIRVLRIPNTLGFPIGIY